MNPAGNLSYDVFVNDPPPQDGFLPNGEPKRFSPMASTLIYGREDAVLTDPGLTEDQARVLGDWVAGHGRNVTDIFITHGHGDHWFAAGLLAERFGARVVATAGTIAQMQSGVATRALLWDKLYTGIPPSPVTAVTVPGDRFTLEGHDLVMVDVGHADTDDNSVLHVPDLGLVVELLVLVAGHDMPGLERLDLVDRVPPGPEAADGHALREVHVNAVVDHIPGDDQPEIRDVQDAGVGAVGVADLDDHQVVPLEREAVAGHRHGGDGRRRDPGVQLVPQQRPCRHVAAHLRDRAGRGDDTRPESFGQ